MIDATLELERGRSKIVKVAYTETGSQALVRVRIRVNSKIIKVACTEMGSQVLRCHRVEMWRAGMYQGRCRLVWVRLRLRVTVRVRVMLWVGIKVRAGGDICERAVGSFTTHRWRRCRGPCGQRSRATITTIGMRASVRSAADLVPYTSRHADPYISEQRV